MNGDGLRRLRERLGKSQPDMAVWLNELLGRRYDRQKISRWESGREALPKDLVGMLGMVTLPGLKDAARKRGMTVAVALQKGGVGKTATAVNLAYVLVRAGHRVLLVDADAQANASMHVGLSREEVVARSNEGRSFYHALTGKAAIDDVIVATDVPDLDLLPSAITLAKAEAELVTNFIKGPRAILSVLQPVRDRYDFIVVDCAPALGPITMAALVAADRVLIPCLTEPHSIVGLDNLYDTINDIRANLNPGLEILGIVPTMYSARLAQDQQSLTELKGAWEKTATIFEPIPSATVYAQAAGASVITLQAEPGAPGWESFVSIGRALIEDTNASFTAKGVNADVQ